MSLKISVGKEYSKNTINNLSLKGIKRNLNLEIVLLKYILLVFKN